MVTGTISSAGPGPGRARAASLGGWSGHTGRRAWLALCALLGVLLTVVPAAPAAAATGDVGYPGPSFAGVANPPSADKPQSKLWFNDGSWWGDMFDTTSRTWHIFRLNRPTEQWVDTGTRTDPRSNSSADVLWDGSHLYVAAQVVTVSTIDSPRAAIEGQPGRLYRYSYSPASKTYSLDTGFPVNINSNSSESLTIDKDSRGVLWATWTKVTSSSSGYHTTLYVNATNGNDASWGTPFVPAVNNANVNTSTDDISSLVAFNSKIGVLWSNQADDTVYWATHVDGAAVNSWSGAPAVRGTKLPDDHLNLKSLQSDGSGRVFAVIKTSLDEAPGSGSSSPSILLLSFKPGTGSWTQSTFGTLADCFTRPLLMLDGEHSTAHVFATAPSSGCPYSGTPGTIFRKRADLDNPVFPAGRGTPAIRDAASDNLNDATSTKQSVNTATGLVVLATNTATQRYWHTDISLGTIVAPVAHFTATPTTGPAPLAVAFQDTSTGAPTSWSWNFGDTTTSTLQNPSHTYAAAGTYPVTLTATNAAGTNTATTTVTATAAPPSGGITVGASTPTTQPATTNVTLSTPAGTVAGDTEVAAFTVDGTTSMSSVPPGWLPLAPPPTLTPAGGATIYGYYHVAGAAEPATSTWGLGAAVKWGGGITGFHGVDPAHPLDTTVVTKGDSWGSITIPGVTTTTNGALVIGVVGADGATPTTIPPAGWTEAWDSTGGKVAELAYLARTTAGPTPAGTWSLSSARMLAGWSVALRPKP